MGRGCVGRVQRRPVTRGVVVPLTAEQRVMRLLYLAGEAKLEDLDEYVRRDGAPSSCPDLFYLLKDHNGGKDPTAPDPADRWSKEGSTFVNRTCDCIGGQAWAGGWDRYQPVRFAHLYGGWINTDSMILDARGPQKCFVALDRAEPGCYVVCASGSYGHQVGHIGGVVSVPAEHAPMEREWWQALGVVDVAARVGRANARTTGRGWQLANPVFIRSVMTP